MILGQTTHIEQAGKGLMEIFSNLLRFQFPTRADFVGCLETLSTLQAAAIVVLGVIYLFYGFKYFKILVVVNGAGIGALLAIHISSLISLSPLLMGLAGAVLLGALAWPMIKYAVGIMGALAGGLIGYTAWHVVTTVLGNEGLRQHAWAGGIVGMVAVGMLTFAVFRTSVMIFTAVQGAIMTVGGMSSLLLASSSINSSIRPTLIGNDLLLSIIIGVPAITGFALQYAADTAKVRKKRTATEKPPV